MKCVRKFVLNRCGIKEKSFTTDYSRPKVFVKLIEEVSELARVSKKKENVMSLSNEPKADQFGFYSPALNDEY